MGMDTDSAVARASSALSSLSGEISVTIIGVARGSVSVTRSNHAFQESWRGCCALSLSLTAGGVISRRRFTEGNTAALEDSYRGVSHPEVGLCLLGAVSPFLGSGLPKRWSWIADSSTYQLRPTSRAGTRPSRQSCPI